MTDPEPERPTRKRKTEAEQLGTPEVVAENRVATKKIRVDKVEEQKRKDREKSEQLQRMQDAEVASRTPLLPGQAGDFNFYVRFIKVGQGDCITLTTPKGQRILIDCGSKATEAIDDQLYLDQIRDELSTPKFLGARQTKDGKPIAGVLDILILTHADEDHYNKLSEVLDGQSVKIGRVYHSGQRAFFGPHVSSWFDSNLVVGGTVRQVVYSKEAPPGTGRVAPKIRGTITLGGRPVPEASAGVVVDCLDGQGGIRIVTETDPFCAVTILAAGVSEDYAKDSDTSGAKNRGSIVTLVEVFDDPKRKKLLLCGDATRSTEQYLIKYGRDAEANQTRLAGVDIVHVAHHGSRTTSSGEEFVTKLDPKERAVISSGQQVLANRLPSWKIIRRYVDRFVASGRGVPNHPLWAWDDLGEATATQAVVGAPVYTTGSHGTQRIDWRKP